MWLLLITTSNFRQIRLCFILIKKYDRKDEKRKFIMNKNLTDSKNIKKLKHITHLYCFKVNKKKKQ